MEKIKIKINQKQVFAQEGETILEVAQRLGIDIPHLCYHPDFPAKANCRLCLVEIKGEKKLFPACATKVREGMEIETESEKALKSRKLNLALIFAQHQEKCPTCPLQPQCPLLAYVRQYRVKVSRFRHRKKRFPLYKFGPALEMDTSQCINCRNCVDACHKQGIDFLVLKRRGHRAIVAPREDKKHDCVYCGQCAVHCPVTAVQEQLHYEKVEEMIAQRKQKGEILVAQIAPSIRVSLGEIFSLPYGSIVTGQLIAALKNLGFDYVFDVNFGADVTTIIEAQELLERIKNKGVLPMFTSCCPAWVRFVEFYYPEFIPHLTTARSPQIHLGGIVKTYWAQKKKLDPAKIKVVSIMPCTAKKFEITREELWWQKRPVVDYVLTTRELGYLLRKKRVDLASLKPRRGDNPLGNYTGGAAIFGTTGGVMESALRTAGLLLEKRKMPRLNFQAVRGLEGIKKAKVRLGGQELKLALAHGLKNARLLLEELKKNPRAYDYIEVMSCPGGCIGGGGQPVPTTDEQRRQRAAALYKIDRQSKERISWENKQARQVIRWLEKQPFGSRILETEYFALKEPVALKKGFYNLIIKK